MENPDMPCSDTPEKASLLPGWDASCWTRQSDVMEFDPDYILSGSYKVADGVFMPGQFVANVYSRNDVQMASFRGDTKVENINLLTEKHYSDVVGLAVEWIREQFDEPLAVDLSAAQLPQLGCIMLLKKWRGDPSVFLSRLILRQLIFSFCMH
ncbi:TPA: hypothetical protein R4H00_004168 [Salmonella enterica subsp. enterica serovar Orientalis]|nr:hypothetical protein [Salmonella enterica subsp. enterica serovar Orientalis]